MGCGRALAGTPPAGQLGGAWWGLGLSQSQRRGLRACIRGWRGCRAASGAEALYHHLGDPAGHAQRARSSGPPSASPEAPDTCTCLLCTGHPGLGMGWRQEAHPWWHRVWDPASVQQGAWGCQGPDRLQLLLLVGARGGPHRVILITSAAQGLYLTPHLLGPHDLGGPPGAQLLRGQPSTLPAPGLRWGEETQPGAQPWILSRVGVAGQGSLN